jgi:transmembrane sensor
MNDRRLTEEAATWYLDMQDVPDARAQARFMAWLRRSPQHVAEYMAMAQMHGDLRAATAAEGMSVGELRELAAAESAVVAFRGVAGFRRVDGGAGVGNREHPSPMNRLPQQHEQRTAQLSSRFSAEAPCGSRFSADAPCGSRFSAEAPCGSRFSGDALRRRSAQGLRWTAAAAAILLLSASVTATWPQPDPPGIRYAAGLDVREVTLDDDTVVQLSPQSAMKVSFDTRARHIELLQGSASFDIGKDPARPMKVTVGRRQIDDVGTVFDVQRSDAGAQVTVVSGEVSVWNLPSPWLSRMHARLTGTAASRERIVGLRGGETARFDGDGRLVAHSHANLAAATQWLPEDIRFHDATVAEVARRFNAYATTPLVVDDPDLAAKRISGVFHARDPEAFIAYIGGLPRVHIDRTAGRVRFTTARGATRL